MAGYRCIAGLCLWFLLAPPAVAQEFLLRNTPVVQYEVDDGLPGSVVYDVAQDHQGYIWIGTDAGLSRFDGHTFVNYGALQGLPDSDVLEVLVDRQNRVWLITLDDLSYLDVLRDTIRTIPIANTSRVTDIYEDAAGNLWLTGITQIWMFPAGRLEALTPVTTDQGNFKQIYLLGEDAAGEMLIHEYPNVLSRLQDQGGHYVRHPLSDMARFPYMHPYRVLNAPSGRTIINSQDGVRWLDDPEGSPLGELHLPINTLTLDQSGRLWMAAYSGGLYSLTWDGRTYVPEYAYLPEVRIASIFEDNNGNLWLPTLGEGLIFLSSSSRSFTYHQPGFRQGPSAILSIADDGAGGLWLGGINGVVHLLASGEEIYLEPLVSERGYNRFLQTTTAPGGELLFLSDMGISVLRAGTFRAYPNLLAGKEVAFGADGSLYLATATATLKFPSLDEIPTEATLGDLIQKYGIFHQRAQSISVYGPDDYWLGTPDGLIRSLQGELIEYGPREPRLSFTISGLDTGPDGHLWVTSRGGGLVRIRGDEVIPVSQQAGLPSLICNSLTIAGRLMLVGTNKGVAVFTIRTNGELEHLRTLTTQSGLPSDEISQTLVVGDQVHLGTLAGLVTVPIQTLMSRQEQPRLYLEELASSEVRMRPVPEHFHLTRENNLLEARFACLVFENSDNVEYRYRMTGLDADWVYTRDGHARYPSIPQGEYRFEVQAKIRGEAWVTATPSNILITVEPFFWETLWFNFGLAGILITMALFIYRSIMRNQERGRLQRLVAAQTSELRQRTQELERSNAELKQFAYVVSHDLKSPLRTMSSFAQLLDRREKSNLGPGSQQALQHIVAGARQMDRLITDILEYAQIGGSNQPKQLVNLEEVVATVLQQLTKHMQDKAAVVKVAALPSIPGHRHHLEILIQNLIENALKFHGAQAPSISIQAQDRGNAWVISVQDNGIGIPKEYQQKIFEMFKRLDTTTPGTGIGLPICKKIANLHDGDISVSSAPGAGTTFYITLAK